MNSGIYIIINKTNGHRYVGSAVDLKDRFRCHRQHLCKEKHRNRYLQRAWNKYGENAFLFEILEECEPEFLVSMEQWWMNMLHPEYNIAPVAGSNLGMKFGPPSEEHRAKLRVASTGRKHSKETLAKMSAAQKGREISKEARAKISAAKMGIKMSDKARANMSAAGKGRKASEEARANMSKAQKGHKVSKETRAKISVAHTGLKRPPRSKEHRAKLSAAQRGRKPSDETRAKMRKASAVRWTPEACYKVSIQKRRLIRSQVHEIRHLLALGDMSQREIAEHFPVCEEVIRRINIGRTYADW